MQAVLFPHIFVWGSCFWFCIPGRFPASRLLCHTPSFTHTIFHIQLCHTPSFTYNFVTHHLSHTIFHIQLCHTPSFTHNFVTHHLSLRHISHTTLSHTIFHTHLCHTPSFTYNFVTHHLSHITSTFILHGRRGTNSHPRSRGRRGTYGTGLALVARLGGLGRRWRCAGTLRGRRGTWWHPPSSCVAGVAGVALGDIHRHLAWQAWHLATSTFVSRGMRGTWWHPPSFHVPGVALMALGWLWWRAWARQVAGDAAAALCVAGVALGDIHLHLAWQAWHLVTSAWHLATSTLWQAWHLWHWASSGGGLGRAWSPVTPRNFVWQAWHLGTSTFILRGRRGTYGTGLALVARLGGLSRRWCCGGTLRGRRGTWSHPPSFAWQAWHLVTSTVILRGRRGTWRHPPSSCVAGAALGDIHLRFTWHAWHLWHWASSGGALGRAWSPVTPRNFAWQAWHLATSTFILRGRRTWRHPPSFHVAGVALMALGWLWWRAWAGLVAGDAVALCVAGVALGDIHLHLAWQAWHLATPPSFHVAGVALMALG